MTHQLLTIAGITILLLVVQSCQKSPTIIPNPENGTTVFAVLGDYGDSGNKTKKVADMVKSWQPQFIITVGDNCYPDGALSDMPANISQYYEDYIFNPDAPTGYSCKGKAAVDGVNRFFPSPGNHDYYADNLASYLSFFTLPKSEYNYDFVAGAIHFFSIDSNQESEYDTIKEWLQEQLNHTNAPFKIVYFHHPPYSSSRHGSHITMQWPFAEWGVTAVLSGHEHVYQHIVSKETPNVHYFVNGLGGRKSLYSCSDNPLDDNQFDTFCYNKKHGAMRVTATTEQLTFSFYSVQSNGILIDKVVISK